MPRRSSARSRARLARWEAPKKNAATSHEQTTPEAMRARGLARRASTVMSKASDVTLALIGQGTRPLRKQATQHENTASTRSEARNLRQNGERTANIMTGSEITQKNGSTMKTASP